MSPRSRRRYLCSPDGAQSYRQSGSCRWAAETWRTPRILQIPLLQLPLAHRPQCTGREEQQQLCSDTDLSLLSLYLQLKLHWNTLLSLYLQLKPSLKHTVIFISATKTHVLTTVVFEGNSGSSQKACNSNFIFIYHLKMLMTDNFSVRVVCGRACDVTENGINIKHFHISLYWWISG